MSTTITFPVPTTAAIDYRICSNGQYKRQFLVLPHYSNVVIGMTDHTTIYLWRPTAFNNPDTSRVNVLFVGGRVDDGPRPVQVFSPDAAVPDNAVEPLIRALGYTEENSYFESLAREYLADEFVQKMMNATAVARAHFKKSKHLEKVVERAMNHV